MKLAVTLRYLLPGTIQLKVEDWHESISDPILADAILVRFVQNAHRLDMSGESIENSKRGLTNLQIRSKKHPPRRYVPTVQFALNWCPDSVE
jgi:hypothetical protein